MRSPQFLESSSDFSCFSSLSSFSSFSILSSFSSFSSLLYGRVIPSLRGAPHFMQ